VAGRDPDLFTFSWVRVRRRLLTSGLEDLECFADEFAPGVPRDKGALDLSMMRNPAAVSIFAIIC
jgi:hypothetical protein